MYDYIFNKKSTRGFEGDHKIFFTFVSKYPCIVEEEVLKSLSDTRLEAHAVAIEAILKYYPHIMEALEYLQEEY